MLVARSLHRRGHTGLIAKRQLDLPPGLAKSKKPNHEPTPAALQPEPATTTTTTTTPANPGGTTLTGYRGGTSTRTQTTTRTTSSPTPSTTGYSNDGSTASDPSYTRIINVGSGYSGPESGGSSDGTTATSGDPVDSTPTVTGTTLNSSGSTSTSGGGIAAAVIFTLLFLIAVLVFILRKRSKSRRQEQALSWGFTQNRTSQSYVDDGQALKSPRSSRSSFATTFDHSNEPFKGAPPAPPPMAQVGRASGTAPVLVLDTNAEHNRFSIGSANSDNSQYLVVHHRESLQPENFRASVTDCMESFPFPKPPPADTNSLHSSKGSRSGFPKIEEPEILYIASPGIRPKSSFPPTNQPTQPPLLPNPFADGNPFDDPTSSSAPVGETFAAVETVCRPFVPQLQDELRVDTGDSVRVVQAFDDRWAIVEKTSPGKSERGMIPLECLRNLEPNSALGGKRVSSQGAQIA